MRKLVVVTTFIDSTGLLVDPCALRARFARDGYLLLRGIIPSNAVTLVSERISEILAKHGWADHSSRTIIPGRACGDGNPRYLALYPHIFSLEQVHILAHSEPLVFIAKVILGGDILVHPRVGIRIIIPGDDGGVTPPHQDHATVRGTTDVCTFWMPLTEVRDQGGLAIAVGSHLLGSLPASTTTIESIDLRGMTLNWATGRVCLGDVLVFNSLTIHASIPNRSQCARLSLDVRMQRCCDPIHPAVFLLPEYMSWVSTYHGWLNPELCYYWRKKQLYLKPALSSIIQASLTASDPILRDWASRVLIALDGP
jgi:hypothetical protein